MREVIQVDTLVDEQKLDWFNLNLLIWSFLAMFCDGYDIAALAFAAPDLVRDWGLQSSTLGPAFSASLLGILFGAPILGFIGDRFGRKAAIIMGCFLYGLGTLAIVWSSSLMQIMVLRFISGIGIGGLMPNTIALNSELSPKRFRATLVVLMFTGITMGSASPGIITTWLAPEYGWQVFFVVGGVVPILISVCLIFFLPESIKYLVQFKEKHAELLIIARKIRPELKIADDAKFEMELVQQPVDNIIRKIMDSRLIMSLPLKIRILIKLFPFEILSGGLRWITLLLWLCFGTALMVNYFLGSWMPLLFEQNGFPPERAALATSIYHIGGSVGGVLISVFIDRFGFSVVVALFILACPMVALIGMDNLSYQMIVMASVLAGVGVLGAQFGNNATAGLLYPTSFRSKGAGWAFAIGRFGAIAGPYIGGILIGMDLSMQTLFLIGATPMVIGSIAAFLLARICFKRFGGLQLDDKPAVDASVEPVS